MIPPDHLLFELKVENSKETVLHLDDFEHPKIVASDQKSDPATDVSVRRTNTVLFSLKCGESEKS